MDARCVLLVLLVLVASAPASAGFVEWEDLSVIAKCSADVGSSVTRDHHPGWLNTSKDCWGVRFGRSMYGSESSSLILGDFSVDAQVSIALFVIKSEEVNERIFDKYSLSSPFPCPEEMQPSQFVIHATANSSKTRGFRYNVEETGMYYIWAGVCGTDISKVDSKATVTGTFELVNPHGYLPASQYPLMIVYGILSLLLTLLVAPYWAVKCIQHYRDLLQLQRWVAGIIALTIIEHVGLWAEMLAYNNSGLNWDTASGFGAFFTTIRATISRALVLVVCLGYGVAKPSLGTETKARIVLLSFVYAVILFAKDLMLREVPRGGNPGIPVTIFLLLPAAFLEAVWYYWIFISLIRTLAGLKARKQDVKVDMYRKFMWCLILLGLVSLLVFIIDMFSRAAGPESWRTQTGLAVVEILMYSATLLFVVVLWRPTSNNTRYAFRETDFADEESEIVLSQMSSKDSMRRTKGGSGSGTDVTRVVDATGRLLHTGVELDDATDGDTGLAFSIDGLSDDDEIAPDAKLD